MKRQRTTRALAAGIIAGVVLAVAAPAYASFQGLPANGAPVNDDPANGIDPARDAGVVDVQGGSLAAGGLQVPWAAFEQKTEPGQQIFVRAFKNGQWATQGFLASLNIDPTQEAEAPSIDFGGAGRTVPWVAWYEPNRDLPGGATNIFASRFAAAANLWLPSGQDRSTGHRVPSLNVNSDRDAENPAVAGGAAVAGNAPVPWVAWQEKDGSDTAPDQRDQIFVSKAVMQAQPDAPCTGFVPGAGASMNGFCWQEVGIPRVSRTTLQGGTPTDASLNVDTTRDGIQPDDAFTGAADTVAWIVWYEKGESGVSGLRSNEMVFAARIVRNPHALGGFSFRAEGNGTAGQLNVLDTSGAAGLGPCATVRAAEDACSLNRDPSADAEDPRVAAGSLAPGKPTVPWVVWSEAVGGGTHAIFVSRLVADHFELFNQGQPISNAVNDSTDPDITFSGHVPYISWHERVNGINRTFLGHFEGGAPAPAFRLDTPTGLAASPAGNVAGQRSPVSTTCTANPFNTDGDACPADALGTPFVLLADGAKGAQHLFADTYAPSRVETRHVADLSPHASLRGVVNPGGAPVRFRFEFGLTAALGQETDTADLPAGVADVPLDALVPAVPGTLRYRLDADTDFARFSGDIEKVVVRPFAVELGHLAGRFSVQRNRGIKLRLHLNAAGDVTARLVRNGHALRRVHTHLGHAGTVTLWLRLKGIAPGRATVIVTARGGGHTRTLTRRVRIVR